MSIFILFFKLVVISKLEFSTLPQLINVDQLKVRAEENLKARSEEIKRCLEIIDKQIIQ